MRWIGAIALALATIVSGDTGAAAQTRYRFSVAPQPVYRAPMVRPMLQSTPMIVQRQPVVVPYIQNRVVPYVQNRAITYFQNNSPGLSAAQKMTQQAVAAGFRVIGWDVTSRLLAENPITGAVVIWATPGVVQ